jgi:hypothetical protein
MKDEKQSHHSHARLYLQPGPSANLPAWPHPEPSFFAQRRVRPAGLRTGRRPFGHSRQARRDATPKEPQGSTFGGLPSMGQAAVTSVQSLHHHRVVVEGGRVAGSN